MIRKLLLIRIAKSRADFLDELGDVAQYFKGDPISISPIAWAEAAGLSHYGYLFEGIKLKSLAELTNWLDHNNEATLLDVIDLSDKKQKLPSDFKLTADFNEIDYALKKVGLRVNKSADE